MNPLELLKKLSVEEDDYEDNRTKASVKSSIVGALAGKRDISGKLEYTAGIMAIAQLLVCSPDIDEAFNKIAEAMLSIFPVELKSKE